MERTASLSLWVVRLPGRRRAHMVAQINGRGVVEPLWTATTTVCGLSGYVNLGDHLKQFCRACRPGESDPWQDAPAELPAAVTGRSTTG
jgi:hypothetical protein